MKRLLVIALLIASAFTAGAASFSDRAATGQTLYFTTTSESTAKVVSGSEKPSGRLVIPATVQGYTVTEIGSMAFSGCTGLTSVEVPGSVATVGMRAFAGCSALTSVRFAEGLRSLGLMAFSSCTALDTIDLPSTLTSISMGTLGNTAYINNPDNWDSLLLYVGHYLFEARSALDGTLTVADGTLGIANNACNHCAIDKAVLPQSLRFIGDQAFTECEQLDSVHLLADRPPLLGAEPFRNTPEGLVIGVPCGSAANYRADANWRTLNIVDDCSWPQAISLASQPFHATVTTVPGGICIEADSPCRIAVYDAMGRRLAATDPRQQSTMVPLPASGVYIVSLDGTATRKICYLK